MVPPANRPAPPKGGAARPAPRPPAKAAKRPAPKQASNRNPNARNRPAFVPGKVTYPNRVTRPAARPAARPKNPNHPAHHANRNRPRTLNQVIANSNVNSNNRSRVTNVTNVTNNRVTNVTNQNISNNWGNQWTNNRASVWNRNRVVNNRPVAVNRNFSRSLNYAYRPSSWGNRPWWSSSTYHNWHRGSWNYGWNRSWHQHRHRPPARYYPPGYYHSHYHGGSGLGSTVAWGLAAWTLGSLAFDSGYNTYRNPYQAPPVQTRTTVINYSQPLSVVAAKQEPEEESVALTAQEKSSAAIELARAEFREGDYLAALKATDESISFAPGDSTLHEYRALCLFALGRYGDAAGVLNPVLASGPGWDWATMSGFYPDGEIYAGQRRKLESYVESHPDSADSHFLLGYHYMVAGFIEEAYAMFDRVVELQPADTVAAQLSDLARSSLPEAEDEAADALASPPEAEEAPADIVVEPIDPTDVEGTWKAPSADEKAITLVLGTDGKFSWNYEGSADGKVLEGEWSIDEEGQLVLDAGDVQMVAAVSLNGDTLQFILVGGPDGDPGLSFERQ